MIKKRILRTLCARLIFQAGIEEGLECTIESTRFNLYSMMVGDEKVFIKGTRLPVNPQTSCLIAQNKFLSKKIFKQNDILVPKSWLAQTAIEAKEIIMKNNAFPCVIKPINGAHGTEIYANIETPEELDSILFEFSKTIHSNILIEEHITGIDYRILVVGKKVSAVTERIPAHVVGDGKLTIKALINKFNTNPLVGIKYEKPMCRIVINFELMRTLKKSKLKLTSIISKGRTVFLKQNANISTGGISKDVTKTANLNSKMLALKASKSIGMEFCGVDIIYNPETKKSYVLEINDDPGIDIHHFPVIGDSQNVAGDIVKYIVSKKHEESASFIPESVYINEKVSILKQN